MVMMGAAVAYLVGAIPFVGTLNRGPIAWLFLLLLPLPLWLIAAFHRQPRAGSTTRGSSVPGGRSMPPLESRDNPISKNQEGSDPTVGRLVVDVGPEAV